MKPIASLMMTASLALAATIPSAIPAGAHHSYSMFDMNRMVEMQAVVARFSWQNPHAFIQVRVPVGNETENWSIEMTSPNVLIQEGWRRTSLKPGDRITLWVHPLRSGAKGGSYAAVRLANGNMLGSVE